VTTLTQPRPRLTVAVVLASLGPGGTQRSLLEMIPGLRSRDVRVVLAPVYRKRVNIRHLLEEAGAEVHEVQGDHLRSRVSNLRGFLKATDPDLVHTMIPAADVIGRLASVGHRAPVLTSLVNQPYASEDPQGRGTHPRLARQLNVWTARRLTSSFHAVSHAVKQAAVTTLGIDESAVTVIERGRDANRLAPGSRPATRKALGLADDARVLVTVGRQDVQKGHRYPLDGLARLPHDERPVACFVGREGEASAELDALVRTERLGPWVRFLGHRDDVPELLAAADMFVMPSLYEGLSGAVIEAMAMGLPIVASAIPGMDELISDGRSGRLVPAKSGAALAAAISELFEDPDRARAFGEAARAEYRSRLTLESSVQRTFDLYQRVVAEGR
jgi:glycosyltransferase involved in cell wall biosynthesis